ncbi:MULTISPECIES: hypothetical protein [unclassified Pseudomonas]|uniref:hypothetical protein n=1 Tax=unclassified Pseudomonas TaxID=196821 RepID=UPI00143BF7B6|nr:MULTISPECIES: hypothetical protein [unclassified Pseudomonas]MCP1467603.1 hypothetical protein [Pseudomonas sp. S3E17]
MLVQLAANVYPLNINKMASTSFIAFFLGSPGISLALFERIASSTAVIMPN